MWLWTIVGVGVAAYCIATGVMFARQKRYVWAALGIAGGILILLMPVVGQTDAVKIDLPA